MFTPCVLLLAVCIGLLLGSFFNVLIYRIPRNESILFPPSHCLSCGRSIRAWENIPLLSFVLLRGKCSGCQAPISWTYPIVEAFTAAVVVMLYYKLVVPNFQDFGNPWLAVYRAVQIISLLLLIPVSVIDMKHYIIPDSITLPGIAVGFSASLMPGGIAPLDSLLGVVAGAGILAAVGMMGELIFRKGDAMGGGDIKLMAFLGAVFGWKVTFYGIIFGSFFGATTGLIMLLTRKLRQDHHIPFGPFLGIGVALSIIIGGDRIVEWYVTILEKIFVTTQHQ